jgi:hypothetical protein
MTCECGLLHDQPSTTSCHDCGTACCRSCALEIDARTFCRWCATLLAAPAA